MRALIIVDIQNDFLPEGALSVKESRQIIPIINALQKKEFQAIVASQDWHPPHHKSFAVAHHKSPGDVVVLNGMQQILWPVHCVQYSPGADFAAELEIEKIEKVFLKGTDPDIDSYSTFFDNAHLRSTGLNEYLKSKEIDEIYLVGLATDYCVKYSALDAAQLGYKVYVIIDACRGVELHPGDVQKAIEEMKLAGIEMVTSDQLIKQKT